MKNKIRTPSYYTIKITHIEGSLYLRSDHCRMGICPSCHLADRRQYIEVAGHNGRHGVAGEAKEQLLMVTEGQRCKRGWLSKKGMGEHFI